LVLVSSSTMTSTLWWQSEWLRLRLHHKFPKASFTQPIPGPTWESWLPSATTAYILILALLFLALALVSAGRGRWLFLVAALPLVPAQIAPGTWAPVLTNQVMYAIVWPAGATAPSTAWSWVSAGLEALVIAVPPLALRSVVRECAPAVDMHDVVLRLLPAGVAVAAVVGWNHSAGEPQDWTMLARRGAFVVVGALVLTGGLRRRRILLLLAVLPALAGGVVRWTTGVDGHQAVAYDSSAWALSFALLGGGAWVLVQPSVARVLRWLRLSWVAMVVADAERRNIGRTVGPDQQPDGAAVELSRRGRAAPVASGGRHRQ
jgi:hypothetical protein